MTKRSDELIFISRIFPDESGVEEIKPHDYIIFEWSKEKFKMNCLSVTNDTWIASGYHSYVVKLKR